MVCMAAGLADGRAKAADFSGLNWSVSPYIWATDTSYRLKADGSDLGTGNINFGDLVDTIDAAFQIVVETALADSRWSAFLDFTYLKTSDDESINLPPLGSLQLDTDSEQYFIDAAISFWPSGQESGMAVYGGLRYTDLDDKTVVNLASDGSRLGVLRLDRDFTDALLGVRYVLEMSPVWSLATKADYGFGDSEGIWQLQAVLRYAVGREKRHGIVAGYRYKEAEFDANRIKEDYEYKGPAVGFNFRF